MNPNRVALVTGSGKQRVGWHVARRLAERGYHIAVHYRTSASDAEETVRELQKFNIEATSFAADLREEGEVRSMIQGILQQFGRLDVLVNCAAIWESKPLEEVTAEDVRNHFDTNTLGTFLCSQHAGLAMVKQPEGGNIIMLGDWAEVRPYLNYAAYFPSKGAVSTMTRSFAVELGSRNPKIRVNCIMPGPVMLPPEMSDAEKQQVINATLVKREGSPENVAAAVLMFLDNDFLTGVCLPVDGGRTIYAPD